MWLALGQVVGPTHLTVKTEPDFFGTTFSYVQTSLFVSFWALLCYPLLELDFLFFKQLAGKNTCKDTLECEDTSSVLMVGFYQN